jgi:hypothetical protein
VGLVTVVVGWLGGSFTAQAVKLDVVARNFADEPDSFVRPPHAELSTARDFVGRARSLVGMSPAMVHELMTSSGILLRRDVVRAGYTDRYLARLVRAGALIRIRQGAYAVADRWKGLDARGRQLLLSQAVMLQYDDDVALSHGSAALAWGGPDHGLDLERVHLTHFGGGGRRSAGVVHHRGVCRVGDVSRLGGHWITSPGRTLLDIAALHGVEAGVVVGDDFVHRGLTTLSELRRLATAMEFWPSTLTLRIVLDLIDGLSESVGETLFRLLFRKLGVPRPELQHEVFGLDGVLLGRSDFWWPDYELLGEFDGKVKYLRHRLPGESIEEAVLREKRREDLMREATGCRMIRFTWTDRYQEERTAMRLRAIMRWAA